MGIKAVMSQPCCMLVSIFMICLTFNIGRLSASELDLTIEVGPGKQECFWQPIEASTDVELDYQVIDGGDNDINVMVISPDNTFIHADQMKSENVIKFASTTAGDYKICFDNTFSRLSHKVVYFELFVSDGKEEDDDEKGFDADKLTFESENLQGQLDMTVKDFLSMMERTKHNLDRSMQVQTLIRVHEARDRNTQEGNFYRVNFFSSVQVVVMLAVSVVQVVLIRSLFKEKHGTKGTALKQRT